MVLVNQKIPQDSKVFTAICSHISVGARQALDNEELLRLDHEYGQTLNVIIR